MEYSILFLPLIGAIFGYLAKYFGDLTSQLLTTFFVCVIEDETPTVAALYGETNPTQSLRSSTRSVIIVT